MLILNSQLANFCSWTPLQANSRSPLQASALEKGDVTQHYID